MTEPHLVCPAPGPAAAAAETPAVWYRTSCERTSRRSCCFPPALPPPRPGLRRPCNGERSRSQTGASRREQTQKYACLICGIKPRAHTVSSRVTHPSAKALVLPSPRRETERSGSSIQNMLNTKSDASTSVVLDCIAGSHSLFHRLIYTLVVKLTCFPTAC